MDSTTIKVLPYLLILSGLIILFMSNMAPVAFVCFIIGIVLIMERMWPEKWDTENTSKDGDY